MTLLPYTGANASSFCATENSQPVHRNKHLPPVYGASRVVQEGSAHLQGQTCWGQFVDHRGAVKPALREQLFANLATVDLPRLWAAFPVPTYTVQAPMQAFYDLYQIGAQP